LLVREGTPVASATSVADLKGYQFAAQANTTGQSYIEDTIQPTKQPQIFDDLSAAGAAMAAGQVDAVIIDVPIAIGMTDQFPGTTVAGQFITNEQYGILFEKGSALRTCVNAALQELKDDGTAKSLQEKYFPGSTELPVIK
jgi:polar amino acid transport system substrate-binding protein